MDRKPSGNLKRMLFSLIKITVCVLIGFGVLLLLVQNAMIYHPVSYANGEVDGYIAEAGVVRLPFETGEGSQEAYWIVRGGEADKQEEVPDVVWLVFSGNAAQALNWVDFLELYRGARAGFLLVDYPGYGACEGSPSPGAILESTKAAVVALSSHLDCDEDAVLRPRLAVLGQSLGGAAGLQAATHYEIRRIVLVAPFTTMVDMARTTVGSLYCQLVRHRWDNVARLAELTETTPDVRVSILHGLDDRIIPVTMSRSLVSMFPDTIELEELPGLGHNDINYGAADRILSLVAK